MADCKPYVEFAPGDLICAEGMNDMQTQICEDIDSKVAEGIAGVTEVENAENAEKLGGKTAEEICKEWLEKALQAIPQRSGYLKLFKRLKPEEPVIIKHDLKACPLVDLYRLRPFEVVCAVDDDKSVAEVCFYLYHSSEKKISCKTEDNNGVTTSVSTEIESGELPEQFKTPLSEVLDMYNVPYTEDSSLGDLETELWKAMFSDPNDDFDMDDYCHSPWFERCCREERTVETLRKKGDWDDLWLKMMPAKTVNLPWVQNGDLPADYLFRPMPSDIKVDHYNMNTVGITWCPVPPPDEATPTGGQTEAESMKEQKLMVLLKV